MKKSILFGILFLAAVFAAFAIPSVNAQSCCSTYSGFVYINGTLAANGTVVQSVVNGANATNVTNFTVGNIGDKGQGYYIVNVPGNPGDNVSFKVNGIAVIAMNGTNASAQPWGIGWRPFNLTMNTSNNGVACFYSGACTTGFCTDGYCCNSACGGASEDCNVAGSLGTCTSTATASSGGGGGSSGAAPGTLPSESQTVVGTIAAGGTADVNFAKSATLGIESIEITVNQQVSSVSVTVKETSAPSSGGVAISSSDGSTYKYLDITPTVSNDKISSAKIQFKVPKSWFDTNSIDPATVVLKKNAAAGWSNLPTTQTKFDGTYYYYESTTTSFSTYAITGQKTQAAPVVPNGTTPPGNVTPGQQKPSISILSPGSNYINIFPDPIVVKLAAYNVNLVPAGGAPAETEGHFHVYLDGGQEQRGAQTEFRFENVAIGEHAIRVELHRNDHSQFDPPVVQSVQIKVIAREGQPRTSGDAVFWAGAVILLVVVLGGGYWYFTKKPKHK